MRISVVYALPERQAIAEIEVAEGTTVAEAVAQSGLSRQFPDIDAQPLACAIYGRAVAMASIVRGGDRIEILRALLIDPKEGRRSRVASARKQR